MKVHIKFAGQAIQSVIDCAKQNFPGYVEFGEGGDKVSSALLVIGNGIADKAYAVTESIDSAGMREEELLFHLCAKLGKLSKSDAITAKVESMLSSPTLSRRELITGIKSGFRVFSDYPLVFDGICEAKYGCTKCIDSCPENALKLEGALKLDSDKCTKCGLCAGKCPVGAIQMPAFSEDAFIGMIEGMNKVNLERKSLMLTTVETKAEPWVHVEHLSSLDVVNTRWIAMTLASGINLIMQGKINEEIRKSAQALGRKVTEKEDYIEIESIIENTVPGFSSFDSWFNYISSINALKVSHVEGLRITDIKVSDTCTLCGACASQCPHAAFKIDQSGKLMFNPAECTGCGLCAKVCPEGSITLEEQKELSLGMKEIYNDEIIRCARCGKPIYTKKFYMHMVSRIGKEDPMLKYCNECKQRIIYESLFGNVKKVKKAI
ncbi:MAG: 4Fe-4S binding protein [Candidatus Micrarchaeaceae archaeon]